MDPELLDAQSEDHVLLAKQDSVTGPVSEARVDRILHQVVVIAAVDAAQTLELVARRVHAHDAQVASALSFRNSRATAVSLIANSGHP